EDAIRLNVDRALVVRAMAGDEEAVNAVILAGNQLVAEGIERMREKAEAGKNVVDFQTAETAGLEQLVKRYEDQLNFQREAKENAEEHIQMVKYLESQEAQANSRALSALDERGRKMQDTYAMAREAASQPIKVPLEADTSAFERQVQHVKDRYVKSPLQIQ